MKSSSLKNKYSNEITGIGKLANKIIDLIYHNANIYNFIYATPMTVNDKNYSMNYVFDDDMLVAIYYNKWNNNNMENNVNYSWNMEIDTGQTLPKHTSAIYNLLTNWDDYANSWDEFTKLYPKFNFDRKSEILLTSFDGYDSYLSQEWIGTETNIYNNSINMDNKKVVFNLNWPRSILYYISAKISMYIWHDDHNIMYQLDYVFDFNGYHSTFQTILNNVIFHAN